MSSSTGRIMFAGNDRQKILEATKKGLKGGGRLRKMPRFWDGKTSERIVSVIRERLA